jgi:hypothetical protein
MRVLQLSIESKQTCKNITLRPSQNSSKMTTTIQSGYKSPAGLEASAVKSIPKTNSETNLKEKKSIGKKIKEFFKKPFTKKAATATEIPFDARTDISSSQNLNIPAKMEWNPYQQPAHGQIFVPGSIAVLKTGNETIAYVPGNIAVAINRPGMNMDSVPMLLAQNTVQETDQVLEETPKIEGELSPKFEVMSPHYNPVDVAAQLNDVEHMNEKDAEAYKNMRESRMLYASNTMKPATMNDPKFYQMQKASYENSRDSIRGSRTLA